MWGRNRIFAGLPLLSEDKDIALCSCHGLAIDENHLRPVFFQTESQPFHDFCPGVFFQGMFADNDNGRYPVDIFVLLS